MQATLDLPRPTAWQEAVLAVPREWDLALFGGKGSGKSEVVKWLVARDAREFGNGLNGIYVRLTHGAAMEFALSAAEFFRRIFGDGMRVSLQAPQRFTFPGGGMLVVDQLGTAGDYQKYMGKSLSCAFCDELGEHRDMMLVDKLRASLRSARAIPTRMVLIGNPGGPNHATLNKRFIVGTTPWQVTVDRVTCRPFVWCPSTYRDNPHLGPEYEAQLRAAYAHDPEGLKAARDGSWAIDRGGYFASVLEESRVMVDPWPEWPQPKSRRHYPFQASLAMDWGSSAPCVVYLVARSPGGEAFGRYFSRDSLILVDELSTHIGDDYNTGAGFTVPQVGARIRDLCKRWGFDQPLEGAADDAIFAKTGSASGSIADEFRMAGVRWHPARKLGRVQGWQRMKTLLSQASRPDVPGLHVSRICEGWWATVPSLQRCPRNPEDVDSRGPDHHGDSCRYAITGGAHEVRFVPLSGTPG